MIDLRSDTITKPTPEMREVMAGAEVGDDVLGDDPTVRKLEIRTAELLGLESAVYMPSGTMTNQIALKAHTSPGDEIFLHKDAHIYYYESGAPAALSGLMCNLLEGERGIFCAETLRHAVRKSDIHMPRPKLLCVENTHNRGGGSVWPLEQLDEVTKTADELGLKTHLDGARLWNAAVALGVSEKEIVADRFDSVSVCFSKGLGAPVGSCLAGSSDFIERSRRLRKMFGGGMRQAGIIAAGALYAMENHHERLGEDHENAKALANGIADLSGIEINLSDVETNIVIFGSTKISAEQLTNSLSEKNVLMLAFGPDRVRAVTSMAVNSKDIASVIGIIKDIIKNKL